MNFSFIKVGVVASFFLLLLGGFASYVLAHEEENSVVVHIDENGFIPKEIQVEIGTKVIFENVGKEDHWPAGDDHPSHTRYANTSVEEHCFPDTKTSFDSCQGIKAGQTWSFTFDKLGEHQYHDHLWPHLVGKVIVIEVEEKEPSFLNRLISFFKNLLSSLFVWFDEKEEIKIVELPVLEVGDTRTDFYDSLKHKYQDLTSTTDPNKAILSLKEESEKDDQVYAFCHDILHEIGRTAYHKYGGFDAAVIYQNEFCNSGYIHGLFETYFQNTPDPLPNLTKQCDNYAKDQRPFEYWQCYHGIGHGLMYFTGGDLDKSLAICQENFKPENASSCINGAYMEIFNREVIGKEGELITENNPFPVCSTREIDKETCYMYIPTYLSQELNQNFEEMFTTCKESEKDYVKNCISGIGSEAMKRNMQDPDKVFKLCQLPTAFADQAYCAGGAIGIYMNQNGSYLAGKKLCESTPTELQDICYQLTENSKDFYGGR